MLDNLNKDFSNTLDEQTYQFDYFMGADKVLLGALYLMIPLPQRKAFC